MDDSISQDDIPRKNLAYINTHRYTKCPQCEHNMLQGSKMCFRCRTKQSDEARAAHLKNYHGITKETYEEMVTSQFGFCAICGEAPTEKDTLCVDHCHKTGLVRQLLCHRCNLMLGFARDNIETLKKAVEYLNLHSM